MIDKKTMHDIKVMLSGRRLDATLRSRGTNRFRLSKATGVAYLTLHNWATGRFVPSDRAAEQVAVYLGLLAPGEAERERIRQEIKSLEGKLTAGQGPVQS
jgi:hypothetical protein